MSRDFVHQKDKSTSGPMAPEVDLDAEHDPKVSRQASNAALRRLAVQMKAEGKGKEPALAAAERGVQSPSAALPHADKIQSAFGAHDVSHIKAHVGDGSAAAMGAEAYATGNHVVFDKQPDLHTAAHEAAHVVQQAQGVNLYGGVGKAGDAYEQNADEVADRVVQGKSAEDLLGTPANASAQGGVVQRKDAPTQAEADSAVIAAIQSHVKLTAARMHAGAANIIELLKMPTGGAAAQGPMMQLIEAQVTLVNDDLDNLKSEISRVPNVLNGALKIELGAIHGAFHAAWAPSLNKVGSTTHDKDGKLYDFAQGLDFSVTTAKNKIDGVFAAAGVDEATVTAVYPTRVNDPKTTTQEQREKELGAAEMAALQDGMRSIQVALDLVNADLHSSVADQSKEALDLTVSVEQLVAVLGPISPAHIGKMSKLPILIKQVETLQHEVTKMKDAGEDKGKALAPKIGTNTQLSRNLYAIKSKMNEIASDHKINKH